MSGNTDHGNKVMLSHLENNIDWSWKSGQAVSLRDCVSSSLSPAPQTWFIGMVTNRSSGVREFYRVV